MAINKKLIHFKNYSDFNSKKLSANEQNTQYTLGVDGVLTTGAPDILYQSICWIKDSKKMWTHGTLYDCSGGGDDINASSFLVIGDSDDEAKANFRAFVNGTASADYYIGSIYVNGGIIFGIARPVIRSAVSGGGGDFEVTGYPDGGGSTSEFIKARCRCSSDGVITTTLTNVLDSKQDKIEDLVAIRAKAAKGATAVQPDDIKDDGYVIANGILDEGYHYWHLPNSSVDEEQYTLASKSDIKDEVYIADFTRESLRRALHDGTHVDCDMQALVAAMNANKIILVRESEDSSYKGVYVLNGYAEDLLYFSIVTTSGDILWCEGTDYTSSPYIDGQTLHERDWDDKADRRALSAVATSGSYNDLTNKPTIPAAVTESTVSGWGFTKNTGTYSKPSGGIPKSDLAASVQSALVDAETFRGKYTKPDAGIPKSDLASAVQTSLGKADTALQPKDKGVYIIPDFTLEDLEDVLSNGGNTIDCQSQDIYAKAENNVICIRVSDTTNYSGVIPVISSVKDDLLYLSFYDDYNYNLYQLDVHEGSGADVRVKHLNLWDVSDLLSNVKADGEAGIALTKGFIYDKHASVYYALPKSANGDEDDILLTRETTKTINGESILGSGNIVISGGGSSSGGNGAYSEVNHGTSDTTFTLTPNTFHIWDEVVNLTLTLGSETSGVANEYLFQFTSGATATSLTLPDDIKWANDVPPTIVENMIYQVSILKGLASVLEFSNAMPLIKNKLSITTSMDTIIITSQYPVASDLKISVIGSYDMLKASLTLQAGNTSAQTRGGDPDWEMGATITSIMPPSDNTYLYTF